MARLLRAERARRARRDLRGLSEEMYDLEAVRLGELLRDERAVACLRVAFDAEERGRANVRQPRHDGAEICLAEDFPPVALGVLRRELAARPLADAAAFVLRVLEVTLLG